MPVATRRMMLTANRQMRPAPHHAPALIVAALALRHGVGAHMRARLLLLAVAIFAIEPQRRMGPEEQQHAADRQVHELRGDPRIGIMREVVGRGVRLERGKARRRVDMALAAGVQQIGRRHARGRIAGAQDGVAAVAVRTGCAIGKTHDDDLAVIRLGVTLRRLRMASDAVLGDGEPRAVPVGRGLRRILMRQFGNRRMAVDAAQRLAVHAVGKLIGRHEQRTRLSVGARCRESRRAVAAEAGGVVEISSALRARGLRPEKSDR